MRSPLIFFFFIVKFVCPMKASTFMADPRILIILFCFFFLPTASRGTEKVLEVVSWPDIHPTSGIKARRYKDADCSGGEQD